MTIEEVKTFAETMLEKIKIAWENGIPVGDAHTPTEDVPIETGDSTPPKSQS